ncbi:hypothetical protein CPU12_08505 [Malaciobacter molluscorum LMG 25693]|uniref:DUF502 domain-containing membrane protein n=1 Tax=Malaciobacter molluscorum LMG 25693 TaxID=870501 RepID=A0A2G1DH05_9BACT|nr:DUF502 domain-containing protein [Malaciobacter molluscorum]AXX93386.1 DUF502 domain-containing membrane protein [Malaciobacter molluscorum LMG 25693]PHO17789.1 hypothetical protein CPU12_08505 [Malaciobacter molluscorum LMG 25693]RXJ95095.1 hypothetical protein CRV00_04885 [Malaciobacter molluscorum]
MLENIKNYFAHGKDHTFTVILKGLFWLAPIIAITLIIVWIYDNINTLTKNMFELIGINPLHHPFLWTLFGIVILALIAYIVGIFVETSLGDFIQKLYSKIPGYQTIKELVNIFNTSKSGEKKVLVVLIKGFTNEGFNIGLMYSTKESIVKDHYTVTLSMTPIPNGGFMFEVPKDKIFIIEEATFDTNLQYLLSMGVKSLADILNVEPKSIEEFPSLEEYLKK